MNSSFSAVRTVTNLNDSGPGSLRDTITAAASGDTINFSVVGTIFLTSGQIGISKNLTITGPGPDALSIRRSIPSGDFRIFQISGSTVTISGLTIKDGKAPPTGNNSCTGIACDGGGIFNNGTLTLTNCVLSDNDAVLGGAIYNNGTLTINNSTFSANVCLKGFGGGIYNAGGRTLTVNRCTFFNNVAAAGGGAIHNDGTLGVSTSTFRLNNSPSGGGGINNLGSGASVTVTSCTFSDNGGSSGKANAIHLKDGASAVVRNTILHWSFFSLSGSPTVVAENSNFTSQGFNLSSDNANGLLTGQQDQINADPKLDTQLRYNGGFTQTLALFSGSAAIDRGKNFGLTTDQRGQPRPIDSPEYFPAPGGDGTDIGAFESPPDPFQTHIPSLMVNKTADHDDGVCGEIDCTLREAIQRSNGLANPQTITFAGNVQGTITLQMSLGSLAIHDSIMINGPGARLLTVSANVQSPVFFVGAGTNTISGLTIRDGWNAAPSGSGGTVSGGGIYNQATLTINDCNISENRVLGGSGGSPGSSGGSGLGGGIFNTGSLTLNRCSFIHNGAFGGSGVANLNPNILARGGNGGHGQGSAVCNASAGTVAINNCTFFNNVANGGSGANGSAFGGNGGNGDGTLFNQGIMSLTANTLNGNFGIGGTRGLGNHQFNHGFSGAGRGGLTADTGTFTVRNTISAGNTGTAGADVAKTFNSAGFISQGFNLIGKENNTGFIDPTDQVGSNASPLNALLGPIQNYGGPTDTMALLYGSPAVDQGSSFGLNSDQRNSPRPVNAVFPNVTGGDGTDIGAIEINLLGGPDSDMDGMSNDFEMFFGVNDPNADPDGDQLTNQQEFQLGLNPLVIETFNSWINPSNGNWQDNLNWSTTLAPASNQTCFIINPNSKTVTINDQTVNSANATLTVSNLTLGATGVEVNTLELMNMTTASNQPFRILDNFNIAKGGALLIHNSSLQLDGPNGGEFFIDGLLTLQSGAIITTNSITTIGVIGQGEASILGGDWYGNDFIIAGNLGTQGTLTVAGSSKVMPTNILVGNYDCGSTGTVAVVGGSLLLTNESETATLEVRSGILQVIDGLLDVDQIVLTNACAQLIRTGGELFYGNAILNPDDDTDGDGLPNGWEQQYGLDPLDPLGDHGALGDPDNDGQTSLDEYNTGTDPMDPKSSFRILSIFVQGDDIRIRWLTAGGKTNSIETATIENDGSFTDDFTPLAILNIGGSGPVTNTFVDVEGAIIYSNRHYRVRLVY